MIDRLNAYYLQQGIHPENFSCRFRSECSKGCVHFTEAKASLVGSHYEAGTLPRILFLSLDAGVGWPELTDRTPEAVRQRIEDERNFDQHETPDMMRRHWYQTHLLASELLRPFDEDMTPRRARGHFAHVNSVKCSQNKRGKSEADSRLFTRCKGYLAGELTVLNPDVVITQGAKARDAFRSCHQGTVQKIDADSCVVRLANRDVLWLASVHQGAWHGAYQMQVANWPKWTESVKDHLRTRGEEVGR